MIAAALASALPILMLHAWPVLTGAISVQGRVGALLLLHVVTGVPSIFLGAAALLLRPGNIPSRRHRWTGTAYLVTGACNAVAGLGLSLAHPHGPPGLYVATGTVALVWLACAAMAWRAARHRRYETHRDWAIRTYVLTWTFVGCRVAQGITMLPGLGADGVTALVWLNWIMPLFLTQLALEWRRGSRGQSGRAAARLD